MEFVKFFKKKYLEVFPDADPLDSPTIGHVIAVFTKNKVGLGTSGKPIQGMLNTTVEGFSPVKEFYSPRYDTPIPSDKDKPDLRSLIHWVPSIAADISGTTSVSFYNSDIAGQYIIIVEGISQDGRLGYAEMEYKVEEKPH